MERIEADVCVVGARFSGLTAADDEPFWRAARFSGQTVAAS